ncbi:MAG TPA: hypothetical protein DD706_06435 [Nitrospiraceae bacterium]|nr:hypothetical protein [Nitrospiraceae bacterium]
MRGFDTGRNVGDAFLDRQWPLRSGKAFTEPGNLLVCVRSLTCRAIFAMGSLLWSWKQRPKKLAQERCPTPTTVMHRKRGRCGGS